MQVLHSARNDGEALHAQFGVGLSNVHDTQLAHMEVERAEGRTFPLRLKLEEICEIYCPAKAEMLREGKDAIQVKFTFPQNEAQVWQNCAEGEKKKSGESMAKMWRKRLIESKMGQKCCDREKNGTKVWQNVSEENKKLRRESVAKMWRQRLKMRRKCSERDKGKVWRKRKNTH